MKFNKGERVICIDAFAELKFGFYTIKEAFCEGIVTYELEELPDTYWAEYRFESVEECQK